MRTGRVRTWTAIALLGWGVCALGSSRPWGYIPLLAGMAGFGATAVFGAEKSARIGRGLSLSFLVLCVTIVVQLIPLPRLVLDAVSPASSIAAGTASRAAHPISIDPTATALGLVFLLALALFFVGMVRTIGCGEVWRLSSGLVALGTLVAIVGILEASRIWGSVYEAAGLPLPPDSMPHGPFSSRNHYAAWTLMSLSLTLGHLCAVLERALSLGVRGWARLSLGLRATLARQLSGTLCAATAMAVALVQTRSRAGILCLSVALVTIGLLLIRRIPHPVPQCVAAVIFLLLLLSGVVVTGMQPIASRFMAPSWSTAHGRLPIWRQAATIARDFRITGSGFNTYQRIVPLYPTAELDRHPYEGAHNDFLQLMVEGGLLVGLPAVAVLGFFVRDTRRRLRERAGDRATEWLRTGAAIGLLLIAAQETVDFSLQIPGNAALFIVLAAIAVHRASRTVLRREAAFVGV